MSTSIQYGTQKITYELQYCVRKSLGITVFPEGSVLVKAPLHTATELIEEKVKSKAPWILRQLAFFKSFEPRSIPRKYVSGETHFFLGKPYRLQLALGEEPEVWINGPFLEVRVLEKKHAKKVVQSWLVQQAQEKLFALAEKPVKRFQKYGVQPKAIRLRKMTNRWGSCTKSGIIYLNPLLIHVPRACIEYVLVHELCHLVHHDHTKKFWTLLSTEMPDWKKWKTHLEYFMA